MNWPHFGMVTITVPGKVSPTEREIERHKLNKVLKEAFGREYISLEAAITIAMNYRKFNHLEAVQEFINFVYKGAGRKSRRDQLKDLRTIIIYEYNLALDDDLYME